MGGVTRMYACFADLGWKGWDEGHDKNGVLEMCFDWCSKRRKVVTTIVHPRVLQPNQKAPQDTSPLPQSREGHIRQWWDKVVQTNTLGIVLRGGKREALYHFLLLSSLGLQDAKDANTLANLVVCDLHQGKPTTRYYKYASPPRPLTST